MQALDRRTTLSVGLLLLALCVAVLFVALGMWQLDRAEQKRNSFAQFELRGNASEVDLNQASVGDSSALSGYRAAAAGRYLGPSILLDNQVDQSRVGYLVYSVFEIDGRSSSLLVNRGWINAGADRSLAPEFDTPTARQLLEGRLSQPPQGGLRLQGSELIESLGVDMWRVQGIDFAALTATVGKELLPITLLLDADAPDGFVRTWTPPGSDEARHLGYAFQWFALAVTVVIVSVVVALRSGKAGTS